MKFPSRLGCTAALLCWIEVHCKDLDGVELLQVSSRDFLFLDSYPRQYVAQRLGPGQAVVIDGNLNESVWEEVPFTDTAFQDSQTHSTGPSNTQKRASNAHAYF